MFGGHFFIPMKVFSPLKDKWYYYVYIEKLYQLKIFEDEGVRLVKGRDGGIVKWSRRPTSLQDWEEKLK